MKRNIVIAAVTAAALIGGGTVTAVAVGGESGTGGTSRASEASGASGASGDGQGAVSRTVEDGQAAGTKVTAAQAIAAALKDTSGTAVSAELDDEDDEGEAASWDVDVLGGDGTWHSVRIDPADGSVLGSHTDDDEDDTGEVRAALKGGSVTAAEAARAVAGKGTVTSVDLDDDGRDKGWEVETRTSGEGEREWRVDLGSGKVTADRDDDSDHDDHDDHDGSDDAGDSDDD
ncbi:hypothetical protein SUDANB145_02345 [Streptomyces sp. enrichment culture]|uniref:PepSY domain-containing protein n=1 Tax=Streptomyces sp. enrichment culture TaxID=1795815 RepID=UPI003F5785F6